jgi:hypothetical protein
MLAGEAAKSEIRELRAGLLDAATAESIVGAFDAAARDEATTCVAGANCGPPEAGVAPAVDAPEVACRLTLLDVAATALELAEDEPVVAWATLLAAVAKFGVVCEVLRPAVAAALDVATAGAAIDARCGLAVEPVNDGTLVDALGALKLPSLAATCGLVTACCRTADAAAASSVD